METDVVERQMEKVTREVIVEAMQIVKARPKIVLLRELQINASRLSPVNKKSSNS